MNALSVAGSLTVDASAAAGPVAVTDSAVIQAGQTVAYPNSKVAVLVVTVPGGGTVNANVSIAGDFTNTLDLVDVALAKVTVGGNFSGTLSAPATTSVQDLNVAGSVLGTALITAGQFNSIEIGGNFDGALTALPDPGVAGSGVINTMTVGGDFTGTVTANEAHTTDASHAVVAGTGSITTILIGSLANKTGDLFGRIETGHLGTLKVYGNVRYSAVIYVHGAGTVDDIDIGGDFSGTIDVPEDMMMDASGMMVPDPDTGIIGDPDDGMGGITIGGDMVPDPSDPDPDNMPSIDAGQITDVTVDGDVDGSIVAQGAGRIGNVTITGALFGLIQAIEDSSPGSGVINSITVGSVARVKDAFGSLVINISAGSLHFFHSWRDFRGRMFVAGAGTVDDVMIDGDMSGVIEVPEDTMMDASGMMVPDPDTGIIGNPDDGTGGIAIGGDMVPDPSDPDADDPANMPLIDTGQITNVTVDGDVDGSIVAQGAGEIGNIIIKGNILAHGSITANDKINALLGTIKSLIVGSGTPGDSVGGTVFGTITVPSSIGKASFGTLAPGVKIITQSVDQFIAGTISHLASVTINNVVKTVTITNLLGLFHAGTLGSSSGDGVSVGTVAAGAVLSAAQTEGVVNIASSSGSTDLGIPAPGSTMNLTDVGTIECATLPADATIVANSIQHLIIDKDLFGKIRVTNNLNELNVGGTVGAAAIISAGSLDTMTVGLPNPVGTVHDMAGVISVAGTLGSLTVVGGTPGSIVAGAVGWIGVSGGFGPVVLDVTVGGVRRKVEVATPALPYPQPNATTTAASSNVQSARFQYFYESGSLSNPQLTIRVTNTKKAVDQFDVSLVVYSDTAKFNLARLDSTSLSGIRNVDVEGDLLSVVTPAAAAFFRSSTAGGIVLPSDALAGVGVRNAITAGGLIQAKSIQALAFGSIVRGQKTLDGSQTDGDDAKSALSGGTKIVPASDTFRVPFADLQPVGFFFDSNPWGGSFDDSSVVFTVQSLAVANPSVPGANIVTRFDTGRASATALIKVVQTQFWIWPGRIGHHRHRHPRRWCLHCDGRVDRRPDHFHWPAW